jgi:hypothetical protein
MECGAVVTSYEKHVAWHESLEGILDLDEGEDEEQVRRQVNAALAGVGKRKKEQDPRHTFVLREAVVDAALGWLKADRGDQAEAHYADTVAMWQDHLDEAVMALAIRLAREEAEVEGKEGYDDHLER